MEKEELQQFLETIKEVLKPKEASGITGIISAAEKRRRLSNFIQESEVKRNSVNNMINGYRVTRNASTNDMEYIDGEVNRLFKEYLSSFNNAR